MSLHPDSLAHDQMLVIFGQKFTFWALGPDPTGPLARKTSNDNIVGNGRALYIISDILLYCGIYISAFSPFSPFFHFPLILYVFPVFN